MSAKLVYEKLRRGARTIVCFAQFALQLFWLGKWVLPRIMSRLGASLELRNTVLQAVHKQLLLFMKTLARFKQLKLKFIGKPLKTPCIVVANHPTLFDYLPLLLVFPKSVCLYSPEARRNPLVAPFVKAAGYIEDDEESREASTLVAENCFNRLKEKQNVIAFPELTRSAAALKPERFRSTVFHAAVETNVAVQPVAIWCDPLFLGKGQSWFSFNMPENRMVVSVLKPVLLQDLPAEQRSARGLAEAAQTAIEKELLRLERLLLADKA